jgi:hypothetical protein
MVQDVEEVSTEIDAMAAEGDEATVKLFHAWKGHPYSFR